MSLRITAGTAASAALIVALAALNVYQYVSAPTRWVTRTVTVPAVNPAPPPSPAGEAEQMIDRFHELFYYQVFGPQRRRTDLTGTPKEYVENSWLGVVCQQNPNDAWVHQEIISEQKPDVIVETGTHQGGGALLWATILAQVNPNGRVVTIDIDDKVTRAKEHPLWKAMVEQVVASSTAPEIVVKVKGLVEGKRVLFILDSDHTKGHVLNELRAYAPLVQQGGYVIVQDGNVNGHPLRPDYGPGPYEAVEAFLTEDDRFTADRDRERFLFSMHPKGYLRRVK